MRTDDTTQDSEEIATAGADLAGSTVAEGAQAPPGLEKLMCLTHRSAD